MLKTSFPYAFGGLILILAATLVGCRNPVATNSANEGTAEELWQWVSQYDDMASVLQLTDEDQAKLKQVHQEHQAKLRNWFEENGEYRRKRLGQAINAYENKDLRKMKELQADKEKWQAIHDEERELQIGYESAIFAAIPESKAVQWKARVISDKLLEYLEPFEPTAEQIQRINELAPRAAIGLNDISVWRAEGTKKLESMFARQVLSADQKGRYEEFKQKNRHRLLKWNSK